MKDQTRVLDTLVRAARVVRGGTVARAARQAPRSRDVLRGHGAGGCRGAQRRADYIPVADALLDAMGDTARRHRPLERGAYDRGSARRV
jgi:hypothetical protein